MTAPPLIHDRGSIIRRDLAVTAVLSAVVGPFAIQVSDRLVTEQPSGREVDAFANKTVTLANRDALVVFGISGLAFINGRPVDARLVEHITGTDQSHPGTHLGLAPLPNIWDIVRRIITGLNEDYDAMGEHASRVPLSIGVAGFQRNKRLYRPISWVIENPGGGATLQLRVDERGARRMTGLLIVTGVGDAGDQDQIMARLTRTASLQDLENEMVAIIRERSAHVRTVGEDVMFVRLTPFGRDGIVYRYVPVATAEERGYRYVSPIPRASDLDARRTDDIGFFPAAFSPYVIVPGAVMAPTVVDPATPSQGFEVVNGLRIGFDHGFTPRSPKPDETGIMSVTIHAAQPRPTFPQARRTT